MTKYVFISKMCQYTKIIIFLKEIYIRALTLEKTISDTFILEFYYFQLIINSIIF